jgi:trigger factor
MADTEHPDADESLDTESLDAESLDAGDPTDAEVPAETDVESEDQESSDEPRRMNLEVDVQERGACVRHVTITVGREDIDRYFDKEFSEMMSSAEVPGFRPGHAPRKLIESRFRKDVAERVKGTVLMDAIAQAGEDEDLSAISEPDIDPDAVELPESGPMTFEFDLEVRPEFDVPQWKGLTIERPVREFTSEDVDAQLEQLLGRHGRLVPHDAPAAAGDYLTVKLTFKYGDRVLASADEEVIRIRPVLSFRDGKIDGFDKLMEGVVVGETRQGEAELTQDAPNVALRGQVVTAIFEVLEVKRLELPEMTDEFLETAGGFETEADLRDAIEDNLKRQLDYEQHRRAREQVTAALTVAADWELPPELLERQSHRELQRAVLELRRSGFGDDDIQAHANTLRQNSRESTARALKEHFILERIAEDEEIEVDEQDYQAEIELIAAQSDESVRRVRARLEKGGMMDALHNQIVERKVIERILAEAEFKEVPYEIETTDAEAIDQSAGGHDHSDIPEAKPEHEETESPESS